MNDTLRRIQTAQVRAGEDAVIDSLMERGLMPTPTLERRYTVFKHADTQHALTVAECEQLAVLSAKVERWRRESGKSPLSGLFIEQDWPEYEPAKAALLRRVAMERSN